MVNLISNAIKFTDTGAVIVRGTLNAQRQQVVLTITDTGPGIAPERQDRLFDAYLDSESLLTRQREGTGLGAGDRAPSDGHARRATCGSTARPARAPPFMSRCHVADEDRRYRASCWNRKTRAGPLILAIDDDYEALEVLQGHLEAQQFRVYGVV